jgi:hypothetical protein
VCARFGGLLTADFRELPLSTRLAIAEAGVSDLLRERRVSLVRGEGSVRGMNAKLWQMSRLRCWTRRHGCRNPANKLLG